MTGRSAARGISDIGIGLFLGGLAVGAGAPLAGESAAAIATISGLASLVLTQGVARRLAPDEFRSAK